LTIVHTADARHQVRLFSAEATGKTESMQAKELESAACASPLLAFSKEKISL